MATISEFLSEILFFFQNDQRPMSSVEPLLPAAMPVLIALSKISVLHNAVPCFSSD